MRHTEVNAATVKSLSKGEQRPSDATEKKYPFEGYLPLLGTDDPSCKISAFSRNSGIKRRLCSRNSYWRAVVRSLIEKHRTKSKPCIRSGTDQSVLVGRGNTETHHQAIDQCVTGWFFWLSSLLIKRKRPIGAAFY